MGSRKQRYFIVRRGCSRLNLMVMTVLVRLGVDSLRHLNRETKKAINISRIGLPTIFRSIHNPALCYTNCI